MADIIGPSDDECIAIVGMSGSFPEAEDISVFWKNLLLGRECITGIHDRLEKGYAFSRLSRRRAFDADFFGISRQEAEIMDPQHRLYLEHAWLAMEDACYSPFQYEGTVGVFSCASISSYLMENLLKSAKYRDDSLRYMLLLHNVPDTLSTYVSYKMNLRGPSISVQCACSSSLAAVHVACQSLLRYECDMALAGGVSINEFLEQGYSGSISGLLSGDGHCRAFDQKATGTVFGSGLGIVVLKRLNEAVSDHDNILAVICGSAMNNDGMDKGAYTAPSVKSQVKTISEALSFSQVNPGYIRYIEAHGTGTPLGDAIEAEALATAYGEGTKRQFIALGSVKSNIGHLDVASGIAGLIKTILVLRHRIIPQSIHFSRPNKDIDFINGPFYVNRSNTRIKSDGPCFAAVNSIGMGGTNVHLLLMEARHETVYEKPHKPYSLYILSAKTEQVLQTKVRELKGHMAIGKNHPDHVAFSLATGRTHFHCRCAAIHSGLEEEPSAYESCKPNCQDTVARRVVFVLDDALDASVYLSLLKNSALYRRLFDQGKRRLEAGPEYTEQDERVYPFLFQYTLYQLLKQVGVDPYRVDSDSDMGWIVTQCMADRIPMTQVPGLLASYGEIAITQPNGASLTGIREAGWKDDEDAYIFRFGQCSLACPYRPEDSNRAAYIGDGYGRLLYFLGVLWVQGAEIDWAGFYQYEELKRISLPVYPFMRSEYWVEPDEELTVGEEESERGGTIEKDFLSLCSSVLQAGTIVADDDLFDLGADSISISIIMGKCLQKGWKVTKEMFYANGQIGDIVGSISQLGIPGKIQAQDAALPLGVFAGHATGADGPRYGATCVKWDNPMDMDVLSSALQELYERHEILQVKVSQEEAGQYGYQLKKSNAPTILSFDIRSPEDETSLMHTCCSGFSFIYNPFVWIAINNGKRGGSLWLAAAKCMAGRSGRALLLDDLLGLTNRVNGYRAKAPPFRSLPRFLHLFGQPLWVRQTAELNRDKPCSTLARYCAFGRLPIHEGMDKALFQSAAAAVLLHTVIVAGEKRNVEFDFHFDIRDGNIVGEDLSQFAGPTQVYMPIVVTVPDDLKSLSAAIRKAVLDGLKGSPYESGKEHSGILFGCEIPTGQKAGFVHMDYMEGLLDNRIFKMALFVVWCEPALELYWFYDSASCSRGEIVKLNELYMQTLNRVLEQLYPSAIDSAEIRRIENILNEE